MDKLPPYPQIQNTTKAVSVLCRSTERRSDALQSEDVNLPIHKRLVTEAQAVRETIISNIRLIIEKKRKEGGNIHELWYYVRL